MGLRQCRHFDTKQGQLCGKGHSLKRTSFANAPCFPRNKDTPCPDRGFYTQEEIDADEAEILALVPLKEMIQARAEIVAEGKPAGSIECPKCHGRLNYTVSSYNGHVWANCDTPNCLQWME